MILKNARTICSIVISELIHISGFTLEFLMAYILFRRAETDSEKSPSLINPRLKVKSPKPKCFMLQLRNPLKFYVTKFQFLRTCGRYFKNGSLRRRHLVPLLKDFGTHGTKWQQRNALKRSTTLIIYYEPNYRPFLRPHYS
jgi:hypothetical protein